MQVLQGGSFPQAIKNQTGRSTINNAGMLLTCNHRPSYGLEQVNIDRRVSYFETKALPSPDPEAPTWIKDIAMECFMYTINEINANIHLVDADERFYELPTHIKAKCSIESSKTCFETDKLMAITFEDLHSPNVSAMEGTSEEDKEENMPSWIGRCRPKGISFFLLKRRES